MNALALNISNIPVRQDQDGRYSLNDLHKASGNFAKHKPSEYLRNQQAKDLIAEIELIAEIPAIKIIKGRGLTGTYACKELVYAYAMWISPAFTLKVIHAYDSLVSAQYGLKQLPEPPTITKAQQGELFTIVANKAISAGKPHAYFWSRFANHFKLASYKDTPADKFDEAKEYLRRLEGDNSDQFMALTPTELSAIIRENMDKAKVGEVMPKKTDNAITLNLYQGGDIKRTTVRFNHQHVEGQYQHGRWFVSYSDGDMAIEEIPYDELVMSFEKFIKYASQERGYLVIKKNEVLPKLQA